jgi:hypothetical protein
MRAAPKEYSGIFFMELVVGSPLVLPGEFFQDEEPPAESFCST